MNAAYQECIIVRAPGARFFDRWFGPLSISPAERWGDEAWGPLPLTFERYETEYDTIFTAQFPKAQPSEIRADLVRGVLVVGASVWYHGIDTPIEYYGEIAIPRGARPGHAKVIFAGITLRALIPRQAAPLSVRLDAALASVELPIVPQH